MERNAFRPQHERRAQPRLSTDIDSAIMWDGRREAVTIRNISAYGALLDGRVFPPLHTRLTLATEIFEVDGSVIWLGTGRCGLLLEGPVDVSRLIGQHAAETPSPADTPPITLRRIAPGIYA
mgnify:CR=1 FL=1